AVKTYTLRRGTTSCGIHSMSFNNAATRLAVSSSNRTIHIFDVSAGGAGGGSGGGSGGGNSLFSGLHISIRPPIRRPHQS
ncbi:hypothetical protein, partial [Salmonella sp. s33260]|uniref:hypothetical protein n=1 Tax=Salmonella sp. s33260 TaxID=3159640 RepID=UPI003980ADF0